MRFFQFLLILLLSVNLFASVSNSIKVRFLNGMPPTPQTHNEVSDLLKLDVYHLDWNKISNSFVVRNKAYPVLFELFPYRPLTNEFAACVVNLKNDYNADDFYQRMKYDTSVELFLVKTPNEPCELLILNKFIPLVDDAFTSPQVTSYNEFLYYEEMVGFLFNENIGVDTIRVTNNAFNSIQLNNLGNQGADFYTKVSLLDGYRNSDNVIKSFTTQRKPIRFKHSRVLKINKIFTQDHISKYLDNSNRRPISENGGMDYNRLLKTDLYIKIEVFKYNLFKEDELVSSIVSSYFQIPNTGLLIQKQDVSVDSTNRSIKIEADIFKNAL